MNSPSASSWKLLAHKGRGLMQVLYDIGPKRFILAAICFMVIVLCWAMTYFHSTLNPRILSGDELGIATAAYAAIHEADMQAETEHDTAFKIADNALAKFDGYARTKEAKHARRVLSYYLSSVKELPRLDERCTILLPQLARDPSAKDGSLYGDSAVSNGAVAFLKCVSERAAVERNIRACRNESLSYLELGRQPPVDTCVYNFETPVVERR